MAQIHVIGLNSSGRFENLGGSNDSGGLIVQPSGSTAPGLEIQMVSGSSGAALTLTGDIQIAGALGLYSYTAGTAITKYDLVYAVAGGSTVSAAIATAIASSRVVGVAGSTVSSPPAAITIVSAGVYPMVFVDATGVSYTPVAADFGKPVYLSYDTAGRATLAAPSESPSVLVRVGYLVEISGSATCKVSIHVGDTFQQ